MFLMGSVTIYVTPQPFSAMAGQYVIGTLGPSATPPTRRPSSHGYSVPHSVGPARGRSRRLAFAQKFGRTDYLRITPRSERQPRGSARREGPQVKVPAYKRWPEMCDDVFNRDSVAVFLGQSCFS